MSKIALTPNASGSGTFTIASPNSDTDRVLTLPDEAGTVLTSASSVTQNSGSCFRAYLGSDQTWTGSTYTTVAFNTEDFDLENDYDTSTYRFTPQTEGYYYLAARVASGSTTSYLEIQKNGSVPVTYSHPSVYVASVDGATDVNTLTYMNGSTDYVVVRVYVTANYTKNAQSSSAGVYFTGHLVRAV